VAVVTKIEDQKNKKRVNIFVDDAFFCGLHKETAVIFGLKPGKEIDENKLQEALFESEVKMAFEKASEYLGLRMHTKKELFEKLLKKGYEKAVINKAIEKLEEYHYVDDELFSKQFASQNNRYSRRMLENKLKSKGVDAETAKSSILLSTDDENEYNLCLKHAKSYVKGKDMSREGMYQKMIASLARKGFDFDLIKRVCKEVLDAETCDIIDNYE